METIVIGIIVAVVAWVIGLFCGLSSPKPCDYHCSSRYEYGVDWGYGYDATRISSLERRMNSLEYRPMRSDYTDSLAFAMKAQDMERKFYAKTPKEQELADLLKDSMTTIEELAKKLDIEIKK